MALMVVFKGGLLVWASDEILRGVNPAALPRHGGSLLRARNRFPAVRPRRAATKYLYPVAPLILNSCANIWSFPFIAVRERHERPVKRSS